MIFIIFFNYIYFSSLKNKNNEYIKLIRNSLSIIIVYFLNLKKFKVTKINKYGRNRPK